MNLIQSSRYIKGNFSLVDMPFADFFNQQIQPYQSHLFPYKLNKKGFEAVVQRIPALTGQQAITFGEFVGLFCIIYNETGGLFRSLNEMGEMPYFFSRIPGKKMSYNQFPNHKAGDQLYKLGVIKTQPELVLWNGDQWPYQAPKQVKDFAKECDFNKFRGRGYPQFTFRANYKEFVDPPFKKYHGGKSLFEFSSGELDKLLTTHKYAPDIMLGATQRYIYETKNGKEAVEDLKQNEFEGLGYYVAGKYAKYYVNHLFLPRTEALLYTLRTMRADIAELYPTISKEEKKTPAIVHKDFTRWDIKRTQIAIMALGGVEIDAWIMNHGGADGFWGPATQKAYELLLKEYPNLTLEKLLLWSTQEENLVGLQDT